MTDVAIDALLSSLGLAGPDAERGRAALREAGLTRPGKMNIAVTKRGAAVAAIDGVLARLCHQCMPGHRPDDRPVIQVRPEACAACGGSRVAHALAEAQGACTRHGIERLVFVGGSPDIRRELRTLGDVIEIRLVDGTVKRRQTDADADPAWADVVIICGASELAHAVSRLYTTARSTTPVVTAGRRGIEAITGALVEHLDRRA